MVKDNVDTGLAKILGGQGLKTYLPWHSDEQDWVFLSRLSHVKISFDIETGIKTSKVAVFISRLFIFQSLNQDWYQDFYNLIPNEGLY